MCSVCNSGMLHKADVTPPSNVNFVLTNPNFAFGGVVSDQSKVIFHILFAKMLFVPKTQNTVWENLFDTFKLHFWNIKSFCHFFVFVAHLTTAEID